MIAKAKIKFIKSLQIKKYRTQEQCFIVEGAKSISELIESDFLVKEVFGTTSYLRANQQHLHKKNIQFTEVSVDELHAMGSFKTNDSALAIAQMKKNEQPSISSQEYGLVLDDIRDPGNLGTIIRTAEWYGVTNLIASFGSTDFYNPKVIAATMGSFTRVRIFYTDVVAFLGAYPGEVYGAFLDGKSIYKTEFGNGGLIVVGNESNGISKEVSTLVHQRVTIPRVGSAESLNAAIATAVIFDNVNRQIR